MQCPSTHSCTTLLERSAPHADSVQLTAAAVSSVEDLIHSFPHRPPRSVTHLSVLLVAYHRSCHSSEQLHNTDAEAGPASSITALSPHNQTGCLRLQRASRASLLASHRGAHAQLHRSPQPHRPRAKSIARKIRRRTGKRKGRRRLALAGLVFSKVEIMWSIDGTV